MGKNEHGTARLLAWGPSGDPLQAVLDGGGTLAVITATEGPSYRPVGARMAFLPGGGRVGSLSSGCIENDLALQAESARARGAPKLVRYGRGSPYRDLELPCGGGLEILLLPEPDRRVLAALQARRAARRPATLRIDRETGALQLADGLQPDAPGDAIAFPPSLRLLIFGKGPEAATFAALVQSAGYDGLLLSPDAETLAEAGRCGIATRHLPRAAFPDDLHPDPWTAIVLFFHDHEMEPPILKTALAGPAFYIGAQGSRRARDARLLALRALGVPDDQLARLRGPIGLIPSARDPRSLAVSVLAEILDAARARTPQPDRPVA